MERSESSEKTPFGAGQYPQNTMLKGEMQLELKVWKVRMTIKREEGDYGGQEETAQVERKR